MQKIQSDLPHLRPYLPHLQRSPRRYHFHCLWVSFFPYLSIFLHRQYHFHWYPDFHRFSRYHLHHHRRHRHLLLFLRTKFENEISDFEIRSQRRDSTVLRSIFNVAFFFFVVETFVLLRFGLTFDSRQACFNSRGTSNHSTKE